MAPPIADYGIIGDCRSAALISRQGSLDWLCWPWFDSPSLFGAVLDIEKGGFWRISPAGDYETTRRYLPGTNILETTFESETGTLRLIDCMPVYESEYERKRMIPDREILRILECVRGEVQLDATFYPCPKYAKASTHWKQQEALGIHVQFV
ncbi:MAG: glycoside hydrolase family 15 protein, partial [Acidobacteria bacterium]